MPSITRFPHRQRVGQRLILALLLGLAIGAIGTSVSGPGVVAAQTQTQPCALLTTDDVQSLAPGEHISDGVPSAFEGLDSSACRYTWGSNTGRYTLAVFVNPASRMFAGMNADSMKQSLMSSVTPGTPDAAIPDVGDAAVFKAYSSGYVSASALLKGRILHVNLDGLDARDKKGQLISLLKSAASRL